MYLGTTLLLVVIIYTISLEPFQELLKKFQLSKLKTVEVREFVIIVIAHCYPLVILGAICYHLIFSGSS